MDGQDQIGHEGEGELAIIISSTGATPEVNDDRKLKKEPSLKESWPTSPNISEDEPRKNEAILKDHIGPSYSNNKGSPRDQDDDNNEEIYQKVKLRRRKQKRVKAGCLVEWMASLCILGCFVASLTVEELRKTVIWKLKLWKWCMLVMVIFCGMLATSWLLHCMDFINGKNYMMRIKDLPFVHCLKRSVQVFIWIGLLLLVWVCLFNHGVERSETAKKILNLITWTLVALLVGTFFWLLKTVLLEIASSKFGVDAFFDRIQELSFQRYILAILSGPPLIEQGSVDGSSRYAAKGKRDLIDLGKLHKMKKEEISSWSKKVLVDSAVSDGLRTASYDEDDEIEEETISSETAAIAAAHAFSRMWLGLDAKIFEDDLLRFLPKEELDLVLPMLDGWYTTAQIDKKALTDWVVRQIQFSRKKAIRNYGFTYVLDVLLLLALAPRFVHVSYSCMDYAAANRIVSQVRVYREKKALSLTIEDTRVAITQLNKVLSGIVVVVTIIIWLLLMQITKPETIAIFLTAAAFAFGNTFKTIFEAAIFIFVVHPFDVGDRCVVDGVSLLVEEMNILTTVFLKLNNEKIYYPNSVLATKPISNYYRSPDMGESVEFSIDFTTPLDKIAMLKEKIKKYLKENSRYWYPNHTILVKETGNSSQLKIALYCSHTMNFQDLAEKNQRRTKLIVEMKKIFEELNIQGS